MKEQDVSYDFGGHMRVPAIMFELEVLEHE